MNKDIVIVLSGISGFFGLVSTIAYFYLLAATTRAAKAEQSLVGIIQGEGIYDAQAVDRILRRFEDEKLRLEALKEFLKLQTQSQEKANRIYDKIKANIDINVITRDKGRERLYSTLIGAIVFLALASLGFGYAIWPGPEPHAKLSIERIRTFDPSKKNGTPGNWLVTDLQRENVITAKSADDFLLPLGFVIRSFIKKSDGVIDLRYDIIGLRDDGSVAWRTGRDLSHVNDWKSLGAAANLGGEKVLAALDNPDAPGEKTLPLVPYLQCAGDSELRSWSGKLRIEVVDHLAHDAVAAGNFSVQFQREKLAAVQTSSCR